MNNIDVNTKKIDVMPLVVYYMEKLHLDKLFEKYIPSSKKMILTPADVLLKMIFNIITSPKPLYAFSDWLVDYLDGIGSDPIIAKKYNDDCLGRNLDRLYKCDRNSLMFDLTKNAIDEYNLELLKIHNDSTTITFKGIYRDQSDDSVRLCRGHNKDFRPDCLQIVYGLNITEDGHVPLSFQVFDGNQSDDTTHISNWEQLRKMLAKDDFIYTADCKLCSEKNLDHIHENGGKFITVVPKKRSILKPFYKLLQNGDIDWNFAYSVPDNRQPSKKNTFYTYEITSSNDRYRLVWILSTSKARLDYKVREKKILKAETELAELSNKINKYKLKTKNDIQNALNKSIKGVENFIDVKLIQHNVRNKKKVGTGRPGKNSIYKTYISTQYEIGWERNQSGIDEDALSDGTFPLITNTKNNCSDVLRIYKNQPRLEKRFSTLKSITNIAPVFLKKTSRIEAIMFLYFVALMIISLIERAVRSKMDSNSISSLNILPSNMKTKNPTWRNLQYKFKNIHASIVCIDGKIVSQRIKGLQKIHELLLDLLGVPISKYINYSF